MSNELAIVTVLGVDRPGIVAEISSALAEANANIIDISMTVLRGFFSMIMVVDISRSELELNTLREELERRGERVGVKVLVLHESVFRFMQRV
ncbi:MAG: ACT domain-containing protein [Candidatus Korarchaeum sp.]|nr:ACT domain-containing protein [Candidatus Korarchaeum sp.]MDW8036315.1 ACT domain-containing protein [Candidatus Korarchaeum sp.]